MDFLDREALMRWLIALLIILIPVTLSDLTVASFVVPRNAGGPIRVRAGKNPPTNPPKNPPTLPEIRLTEVSRIDREAFLANFARQAGAELVPCLKSQGERLGSISLIARLSKQGKLTAIRLVSPKTIERTCVETAIEKMSFDPIGSKLQKDSVEIAWRFEW